MEAQFWKCKCGTAVLGAAMCPQCLTLRREMRRGFWERLFGLARPPKRELKSASTASRPPNPERSRAEQRQPIKAHLTFEIEAPSPEVGMTIAEAVFRSFNRSHGPALRSDDVKKWLPDEGLLSVGFDVACASNEEGMAFNAEFNQLIAQEQRSRGIRAARPGTIAVLRKS